MAKFRFKLQKLLEYRELQEKWAKDAYLEIVARRNEVVADVEAVKRRRETAMSAHPTALDELVSLDSYLTRLDDDQRALEAAVAVIEGEVEEALAEWNKARLAHSAIVKLRDKEFGEWMLNENRREQADLDEWSSQRRAG